MLNRIITFSIQNKLIIGLFILALIGYGSYQFTQLPIDAVPDITDNQVQVITTAPSLGAPDIERLITFPIEQANSNIPGLIEIRSFSRFGLSLITIVFDDDVDIYWARQQVTERLKLAQEQIPEGLGSPELAPVTTGLGEIYQYVIRADHGYENKYDATELRTIQDWIVRRQLLGVEGVADVSSFGGKLKQYEVAVDANKLNAFNITISDVFNALESNNENTGGAYIEKKSTVLYIRTEGLIGNIDDIKNIVVKNTENGTPVLINDISEVGIGSAIRYGAMTYNDEGEAAGAVVMMLKGENSSAVIERVKERIAIIEKTLPEGVIIEPFLDRTKMVNSAIGTVEKNLLEGALIVIFILVIFLGNFRAGILVASVIPLSMLFAVIMMNIFGVSGNLMSLGALDFGLIVDGAVIIVEAVMHAIVARKLTDNATRVTQAEMDHTVNRSASRMMNSAVFGQIIILIVYLPIFTLEGIEGKMFKPMAQTVAFALLGAFILSLTYIPMMSALFLSKKVNHKKNISDTIMQFFTRIQQKYLKKIIPYPKMVISFVVTLFVFALYVFSTMGGEFIPELPEGDFAVETRVLPGSNITTTVDGCLKAAHILETQFPEVEKVVAKIGSGEIPTDPMPMEAADLMIILKDKSEWTSAKTWDELAQKMSDALLDVPGVTYSFQYPVAMRFNELMTGAKQDVVCKIFGENLDTLSKYSKVLGEIAGNIEGAENIFVEPIDGLPQVTVHFKREMLAQYGLNVAEVNKVINTAFAGQSSGQVFEDEKRFDLVVRLAGENRQNVEDVQNILIPTHSGIQIPLYQVADVGIEESINQIQREDAKRRIIVGFNVSDRDVKSIVADLQTEVDSKLNLPAGYYVTYGGAFENLVAAQKRLSLAVPIALLLIFLFLYFAFGSVKQGLLIYSAIPLSAIGGVLLLAARDMPFSISAGIGFIALFGVSVLNGIVLIAEFNRIKSEGETNTRNIVLNGTKNRLRPVLMTAFVASLGFLPMALSNGAGAEVQRPLATVVIGGLMLATLLTLFVLPVLYILFEHKKTRHPMQPINKIVTVLLVFTCLLPLNSRAQTISLNAAIDTALKNNTGLKNEQLNAEYAQKLKAAAWDIPATEISKEYGQINSALTDTKFGIAQTISFPTVYSKQKVLQNANYESSLLAITLQEAELKKAIRTTYFEIISLWQKQDLLLETDSMYQQFLEKVTLQFDAGENTLLEKITAENMLGQIRLQLSEIVTELEIAIIRFQYLLNSNNTLLPEKSENKLLVEENSGNINASPELLLLQQEIQTATVNTALQKVKLLPTLTLGYSNQSIQGNGADNVFYDRSTRFNAIEFGIGIPIFFGAQKALIDAGKTQELIAQNNYDIGVNNFKTDWQQNFKQYTQYSKTLEYYEKSALPNATLMLQTANARFENGDISYLEWVMLVNNVLTVKSAYIDALQKFNLSIITLNYLNNK
ncbi:MAG: CusA/CzcA family heavy metal efflux RND transporter [Bacteroidetes bacterium]|nr:CusA/CzcA family heavy metal efflux RND transporter [Bacteroidota bacterium]